MKAHLKYYHKILVRERYIVEMSIHEFTKTSKYPDGIRFRLVCKDMKTDDIVLIDNHHPKGPHVHLNEKEMNYDFVNEEQLVEDFKNYVYQKLGVKL